MKFFIVFSFLFLSINGFAGIQRPVLDSFNQQVTGSEEVIGISAGIEHTCYLYLDHARCFGINGNKQSDPVYGFKNAKKITSGLKFNCVLDEEDRKSVV